MSKKTIKKKESFSITNLSKKPIPLPKNNLEKIKNEILGKKYNLSVVFVDSKEAKKLNLIYRGKNKAANVLSFPISEKEGEIFINLELKKTEAEKFNMSLKKYFGYLLIHGSLHLIGFEHCYKMEEEEDKFLKKIFK